MTHWEPEGSASQELAFAACVVCAHPEVPRTLESLALLGDIVAPKESSGNSHKSHSGLEYHQDGECTYL